MDALLLSRLQFAAATFFHFLFVPLTLGLSLIVAIMETKYVNTGEEIYLRMTKFWGKLFLLNFAVGVVTGITLEFQFGTNWSKYSTYVGDIFGSLLAIEATAAFFLESTFIAVWVFGWKKLSKKAHMMVMWLVFIGSNLSAVWILLANGWMQNPVGYVLRNGRAELDNFFAVVTNPFAWHEFMHTVSSAFLLSAFFVMGVSAYHLLKKQEVEFFTRSFKLALIVGLATSLFVAGQGHFHGNEVAKVQPSKLAAMESHWETQAGAPMYLLQIPDEKNEGNLVEALPIPGLLSILAYNSPSATVKGLKDFPKEDRPPVALTFYAFRLMVGLGTLFIGLMILGWMYRDKLTEKPWFLRAMLFAIPLPYIAIQAGWIVAEVGRQPWIVYGLMRTSDAVSPVDPSQVAFSMVLMCVIYALLGVAGFSLIARYAAKGPETHSA
ncbi:MAG: cytochrome ubiquinol oxidase subunit I [Desulfovibrio sp.]|uniref:cytochrome ubiquinol oxidase subunit I n=1 Tax=Desulfovibrio sp. 7SRBS1 TaxID=3378064 RepID=UPI003B3E2E9D